MTNQTPENNTPDENPETQFPRASSKDVVVKVGKMRSIMWCIVVLSGIVCGFLFATSLFGIFGSVSVTLFGCLATCVLAVTLFSLSKNDVILVVREEAPAGEVSVKGA